ncbi:protein of unknown function [Mariniphaga anaerophila]|uniref:Beta-galactosidase n=1 Tax=Mariniphaga anaerophila TaxID=1484053 RepID=A0A1M4V8S1_9BACT|nr:sugar-binding domain-containing protein [Mariniphaga anaerophila]SHE65287.1 protein of unknown function [Mariniphaga anaerophila]
MKLKLLSVFFVSICLAYSSVAQVSFGNPEKINDSWKFLLKDVESGADPDLDDSKWSTIELPHDWSIKQQLSPDNASASGYLPGGVGWYRKYVEIPKYNDGKKVYLYFEGVYNRSEVYLNGVLLGKRPNGYVSFMYDATPYIKYGEKNVIAVKVDHSQSADSRWYTGSGIYRNVWIVYANSIHVEQWGVYAYPEKVGDEYDLNVEVSVENGKNTLSKLTVRNKLFDREDKLVAESLEKITIEGESSGTINTRLRVQNPLLWSLSHPTLYTLKTLVYNEGELVDEVKTNTGFRTFSFDPNKGFALNNEWMKVKGVCLHHDGGVLGAAVPREVWKRRLLILKEIGVNAIRTSHNPQAPDLYELCDELGLLVLNEIFDEWEFPKRKWLKGWNVGIPGFQGSFDYFDEWGEIDLADVVRRDRNHISVFAWSIGNEVDYPNDPYSHPVLDGGGESGFTQPVFGGYKKDAPNASRLGDIAKRLVKVVKQYDQSRPTTAGLAGVAMSNKTDYPFALDITGYNYTESLYERDHVKYPERVIFGSENRHDLKSWNIVEDNEFVFGQFLWTGIDYLGESGRWPSRGFYSGLVDFGGFIKPRGYFRRSLWSEEPMAYLGTYPVPGESGTSNMEDVWSQLEDENQATKKKEKAPSMDAWPIWNYRSGQLIRVVCYTNAAKAKLLLNNETVGETKNYDKKNGIIFWDIPYTPGKLEVIAMDAQNLETSRSYIQTSGRPYKIKILPYEKEIKQGGVAQVAIQIVDDQNVPVMLSEDEIKCQIYGDAHLLGIEASNNKDMTDYTDNVHRAFHGRLIAYIKAGMEQGEVMVRFSANWLNSAEAKLQVK